MTTIYILAAAALLVVAVSTVVLVGVLLGGDRGPKVVPHE